MRAEKAASFTEYSARRANEAAKKCETILERIMAK